MASPFSWSRVGWSCSVASLAWLSACGGGSSSDSSSGDGIASLGDTGESESSSDTTIPDTGETDTENTDDGGPECMEQFQCGDEELCIDGSCCAIESACGDECCDGAEACVFNSCVVPGDDCTTTEDCAEGEYCELSLGEPGGGFGDPPPGGTCSQELPPSGKCVPSPIICTGEPDDPPDCLEACEFQPEPGDLDAVIEWSWGLPEAEEYPQFTDVWATPTVARIYDANCDGKVDSNDPPNMVFVSGNSPGTCCSCGGGTDTCQTGVLRMLDGTDGQELWSLDKPSPNAPGFAGLSVALGDIDNDGSVDIIAADGDGFIVMVDRDGEVQRISDQSAVVGAKPNTFGWGGGIAIGDMNQDGFPEIALGASLFTTTDNAITRLWTGANSHQAGRGLSHMVDLDGDGALELLAGNTAYEYDGTILWQRNDLSSNSSTAVGDVDDDGDVEAVLVQNFVRILNGATGADKQPGVAIPGNYNGGPPTIADFDGDGLAEIGVAGGAAYVVYEVNGPQLTELWQHPTKDTSSSVTGSSVFDFEGDGRSEVIYSDECFLRVLDGVTGELKFAAPNTTFTATEALIVADVDGDDSAEIVRVSNSANWSCDAEPWISGDPDTGLPAWEPPEGASAYRGLTVFGDKRSSWVGTRTIWNQHAYHVTNICEGDDACEGENNYGQIPVMERENWLVPWLNNFRQNVQQDGLFDAPDAVVALDVECTSPVTVHVQVRNNGLAPLPAGIVVEVFHVGDDASMGTVQTLGPLGPGQVEVVDLMVDAQYGADDEFYGVIVIDEDNPNFVECRPENNQSDPVAAKCSVG